MPDSGKASVRSTDLRSTLLALSLCVVATIAVYATSLRGEFVNYDDDVLVTGNAAVRDFDVVQMFTGAKVWQDLIPVTSFSYAVEHAIFGFEPFWFHLDNLLLHLLNTALVLLLVLRLSAHDLRVATVTALLFALHPLQVEAVCWVSGRKDLLATLWFLTSLLLYLGYVGSTGRRRRQVALYALCLLAAVLACLAKSTAMTLPIVLLLFDHRLGRLGWRAAAEKAPFLLVGAVTAIVAIMIRVPPDHAGHGALALLGRGADAVAFYLHKAVVPTGLSVYYDRDLVVVGAGEYAVAALVIAALVVAAVVWRNRRSDLLLAGLFFLVVIGPSLKLLPFARDFAYADRYLYLPGLGLFYGFAIVIESAVGGARARFGRAGMVGYGAVLLGLMALAGVAHQRTRVWQSSGTLWADAIAEYPDTAIAHGNLGVWHLRQGRVAEAEQHLVRTILLDDGFAEGHYNLGVVYQRQGQTARARTQYARTVELDPRYVEALNNLGVIYEAEGRLDLAEQSYRRAIEFSPRYADAHLNLGNTLLRQNRLDEARAQYQRTLEIAPRMTEALNNLAVVLRAQGDIEGARKALERVLEIDPAARGAHTQLAEIYDRLGSAAEAKRHRDLAR